MVSVWASMNVSTTRSHFPGRSASLRSPHGVCFPTARKQHSHSPGLAMARWIVKGFTPGGVYLHTRGRVMVHTSLEYSTRRWHPMLVHGLVPNPTTSYTTAVPSCLFLTNRSDLHAETSAHLYLAGTCYPNNRVDRPREQLCVHPVDPEKKSFPKKNSP